MTGESISAVVDPNLWPVYVAIAGILFAIFRFNQTQRQVKNLEFMKQLEHYDDKITKVKKEFNSSSRKYDDCVIAAKSLLLILDRMSFLKTKKLINKDFLQFFENSYNSGMTYLSWLEFTSNKPKSLAENYPYFRKIKDTIDYSNTHIMINSSFYYYVHQFSENSNYNPKTDNVDPKTYVATDDVINLLASK